MSADNNRLAAKRKPFYNDAVTSLRGTFVPRVMSSMELFLYWRKKNYSNLQLKVFYRVIDQLISVGHLKRVKKDLYANFQAVPAIQNNEIATFLVEGSVITMHSSLYEAGALNNPTRIVTASVPCFKRGTEGTFNGIRGAVREIKTEVGDFWFFNIPSELVTLEGVEAYEIEKMGITYKMATPEKALMDWVYIGTERSKKKKLEKGSELTDFTGLPPLDIAIGVLNIKTLKKIASAMHLSTELNDWLDAKREYDKAQSVMENMSPELGY